MAPHTRSMIAAAAFACRTGKKVAGLYDHAGGQDRRIAAEFRANQLQGFDGDRNVRFGGTLPEIYDAGDKAFVSFEVEDDAIKGYDRSTSTPPPRLAAVWCRYTTMARAVGSRTTFRTWTRHAAIIVHKLLAAEVCSVAQPRCRDVKRLSAPGSCLCWSRNDPVI
jgi:hypothetical protein